LQKRKVVAAFKTVKVVEKLQQRQLNFLLSCNFDWLRAKAHLLHCTVYANSFPVVNFDLLFY